MERKPLLLQLIDPNPRRESQTGTDCFDFEFPRAIASSAAPNGVVFCGKVIIRRETQPGGQNKNPFLLKWESFSSRWGRIERQSRSRKHRNGLFGVVKFPLQMELSDMKMRQERTKPPRLPLPKPVAEGDGGSVVCGGESCWDMVRPLRRRSRLMNALAKATFGCIPVV